jgi:hypothetical protein
MVLSTITHRGAIMTDPRNIAHDKKVQQEKKHHGIDAGAGAEHAVQPGKKPHMEHASVPDTPADSGETSQQTSDSAEPAVKP